MKVWAVYARNTMQEERLIAQFKTKETADLFAYNLPCDSEVRKQDGVCGQCVDLRNDDTRSVTECHFHFMKH